MMVISWSRVPFFYDYGTLQHYQPDYQPDYQLRADSSNYRADSSNYQADSSNYQPSVGPGRLILQLAACYFQGDSCALRTFFGPARPSPVLRDLDCPRANISPPDCAPGFCCAPHSPSRMVPAPQRCKQCRKVFPNADKLHGHLGRSARCLEAYVSCLLYTSPSPRDLSTSRMPSSA